ncbi:MAG: hypothetical protein CME68_11840 [Halobacteriovoraceae bacterium]|nr:hypothetical protein [Halobacteriovoraceae bacterium]
MDLNKYELKKNYLSKIQYPYGWQVSLLFIFVITIFSNIYWQTFFDFNIHLEASHKEVLLKNKYWKAWTTTLIHSDVTHLLSNTSMLLFWGFMSTSYYGPLFYPFISFFMNGFLTILVLKLYPENTILLGSSGLVFFLGGHWITLYIFIDRKVSLPKRIFKAFGVALILFFPSTFSPSTSYLAHYVGLIGGFICGILHYFYKKNKFRAHEYWVELVNEDEISNDFSDNLETYDFDDSENDDLNKKRFYH